MFGFIPVSMKSSTLINTKDTVYISLADTFEILKTDTVWMYRDAPVQASVKQQTKREVKVSHSRESRSAGLRLPYQPLP